MSKSKRQLLYNSTLGFVLAGLIATTLHEVAHFATAIIANGGAILTPANVGLSDTATTNQQIMVAMAGPLFSLISGLLIIYLAKNWGKGFGRLFWLWLGYLSAQIGFGYFLVCSFAHGGDTGQALSLLNANWLVYAAMTAVGAVGTYFVLPKLFSLHTSGYVKNKKEFFQLGMYPWLIGTFILIIIYAFTELVMTSKIFFSVFSLVGTATVGIFVPLANYNPKTSKKSLKYSTGYTPLIITIALALFIAFVLSKGWSIG